ncbi:MAG: hypothetical protein QNJ14_12140 [Woeseiaceae bacterium]|nr:hypothetical protein [Woeseiaceae bacterium]
MGLRLAPTTAAAHVDEISFDGPGSQRPPVYSGTHDYWFQPLPRYSFETTLEHRPGRGGELAPPQRYRAMTFGIVLNILYEFIEIDYGDAGTYWQRWTRPVNDSVSRDTMPFVHEPSTQILPIPMVDEQSNEVLRVVTEEISINPSYERFYGPDGLGELLNPFDQSGYRASNHQRLTLRFQDQPRLSVRATKHGEQLRSMSQVLWFKFWVIGTPGRHVFATSPPFTLGASMQVVPGRMRSMRPRPKSLSWGIAGRHRQVFTDQARLEAYKRRQPRLPIRRGLRGRRPVLTGQIANERLEDWVRGTGLMPIVPSDRQEPIRTFDSHR